MTDSSDNKPLTTLERMPYDIEADEELENIITELDDVGAKTHKLLRELKLFTEYDIVSPRSTPEEDSKAGLILAASLVEQFSRLQDLVSELSDLHDSLMTIEDLEPAEQEPADKAIE